MLSLEEADGAGSPQLNRLECHQLLYKQLSRCGGSTVRRAWPIEAPESLSTYGDKLEAAWLKVSAAATHTIYACLSYPIRRLCANLQTAASVYGYLDPVRAITSLRADDRRKSLFFSQWSLKNETPASTAGGAASCIQDSFAAESVKARISRQTSSPCLLLPSIPIKACAAGVVALISGVIAAVFVTGSVARLSSAVLVGVPVGMAACCVVLWGLMELLARYFCMLLYQLLADMQLQHKLVREAIRWIQELEVTVKAFSGTCTEPQQQHSAGTAGISLPCTGKNERLRKDSCAQPQEPEITVDPPYFGKLLGSAAPYRTVPETGCFLSSSLRMKELPASHLRFRLYQVLDWQERAFCHIYDNILRPKAGGGHLAWASHIALGPWGTADGSTCGNRRFDGSIRSLKDASTRSWLLHSRICTGFQIALRNLLFSLDARFRWGCVAVEQKIHSEGGRRALLPPTAAPQLTRRTNCTLRRTLLAQQQKNSADCRSLGEEVERAGRVLRSEETPESLTTKNSNSRLGICRTVASCAPSRQCEPSAPRVKPSASEVREALHRFPFLDSWTVDVSRAVVWGVFGSVAVLKAVFDGIRASWWLLQRLNQLRHDLAAATLVATEAANALRIILEEDWASCPVRLPQPQWVPWMFKNMEEQLNIRGSPTEPLHLLPCAVSPPVAALHACSPLSGVLSPAPRTALASMSRNIAAALAILRLPSNAFLWKAEGMQGSADATRDRNYFWLSRWRAMMSGSAESTTTGGPRCASAMAGGEQSIGDAKLCSAVQLVLRHLHAASEEGEKLMRLLRLPGKAPGPVDSSRSPVAPQGVPPKSLECSDAKEETHCWSQSTVAEPVQCLEVYTAVGQESSSNKRRFQEEADLLAAFEDKDPIVQERSQLTLRELKFRLKSKNEEQKCFPRVVKELLVGATDSEDASDSILRVVTEGSHASWNCPETNALHESSAPLPGESGLERDFKNASVCGSEIEATVDEESPTARQAAESSSSSPPAVSATLEAMSLSEECSTDESKVWLEKENMAFLIRQQQLKGPLARNSWQSPEFLASQSLISQLEGELVRRRTSVSGDGENDCPATALGEIFAADSQHRCDSEGIKEGTSALRDDLANSEE
ncbi:hypothetical protein cyc_02195 [Cyclospora cayetanensis]|uniref:Transmembrane protein n=1 Tax=Cyclospora cayetanensis TaxID=88456 RepID=A0A1D3D8Y9_9EIME|nr:hypothetical protein cyc_02195 [Cyclospora cayetanensis]